MSAPMTPDVALTRLRQYGERTSTWSTATYNDGTEKALHQIALSLASEVEAAVKWIDENTPQPPLAPGAIVRVMTGLLREERALRARVAELEARVEELVQQRDDLLAEDALRERAEDGAL